MAICSPRLGRLLFRQPNRCARWTTCSLIIALAGMGTAHAARPPSTRSWELVDLKAPEKVKEEETVAPPRRDAVTGKLTKAEYAPYRTQTPVNIDGVLDDEAWVHAKPDSNFYSRVSIP